MYSETDELIRALAENAEGVCRAYLPAGRREGSYWIVGDLQNNPGRSLFVRRTGPASGPGAAGKFTDGATGEHGDLLDIIRERTGISRFPDLLAEARAHLGRPQPVLPDAKAPKKAKAPRWHAQRQRRACLRPRCRSQARLLTPTSAPGA